MSKALGAAFLKSRVEELEKSVNNLQLKESNKRNSNKHTLNLNRKKVDKIIISGPLQDTFKHISHTNHQQSLDLIKDKDNKENNINSNDIDYGLLPRSNSSVGRLGSVKRKPVPTFDPVNDEILPPINNPTPAT